MTNYPKTQMARNELMNICGTLKEMGCSTPFGRKTWEYLDLNYPEDKSQQYRIPMSPEYLAIREMYAATDALVQSCERIKSYVRILDNVQVNEDEGAHFVPLDCLSRAGTHLKNLPYMRNLGHDFNPEIEWLGASSQLAIREENGFYYDAYYGIRRRS